MQENQATNYDENTETQNSTHGWQKVVYPKRQRKTSKNNNAQQNHSNGILDKQQPNNVFRSIEEHSEERRKRVAAEEAALNASISDQAIRSKKKQHGSDEDYEDDSDDGNVENEKAADVKKVKKPKKEKKPKVSVAEASAKIDASDLSAFLVDATASYENQDELQMKRLADYFGRAFAEVNSSQFPWVKMFRESPVAKIVDIPLSHISDAVYKTSVDWINKRALEALASFALWSLDSILADLATHQPSPKNSKKVVHPTSSKSQVAIFVVLAMVLRRKPDALVAVLPTLRENSQYQGQDKLPVFVWMMAQACQGELTVGLYSWAHNLLPMLGGKSSCNPQSRDLVLQLAERILSGPKARSILVNGAVRKGERAIPPASFDVLMRVTFPASSARVKATERFEAIYPTLKEVALAGVPGSKAMKQVSSQIFGYAIKAAGESIQELSKEATNIAIWCLSQHADCYKQWEKIYEENLEASVAILKKLSAEWKEHSVKHSSLDSVRETLTSFRQRNEEALANVEDHRHQSLIKDADKYCKVILGRLSSGHLCLKMSFAIIAMAAGAAALSSKMDSYDWSQLPALISSYI